MTSLYNLYYLFVVYVQFENSSRGDFTICSWSATICMDLKVHTEIKRGQTGCYGEKSGCARTKCTCTFSPEPIRTSIDCFRQFGKKLLDLTGEFSDTFCQSYKYFIVILKGKMKCWWILQSDHRPKTSIRIHCISNFIMFLKLNI